jgi:hypothetical protein
MPVNKSTAYTILDMRFDLDGILCCYISAKIFRVSTAVFVLL